AVQIARSMGYTVYATASPRHHELVKKLGAKEVFDYKEIDVVEKIIETAKRDGLTFQSAYDAAGALAQITEILKALKGSATAKIASAIVLKGDELKCEGIESIFVAAPEDE